MRHRNRARTAASFLNEKHGDPDYLLVNDNNSYVLDRIGKHNIIIAALPDGQYGLVTAAIVARDMVRSFINVKIGLMVGVGGRAPSAHHDVRLGDVMVSSPGPGSGGIPVQLWQDYSRLQIRRDFAAAIATLKAQYKRRGHDIKRRSRTYSQTIRGCRKITKSLALRQLDYTSQQGWRMFFLCGSYLQ